MRIFQLLGPLLLTIIESRGTRADASLNSNALCNSEDSCVTSDATARAADDIKFEFSHNSSMADVFNPKILDEQVLADIKSKVSKGHLVVLRDAFILEFAEHVWKQLTREDVPWQDNKFSSATSIRNNKVFQGRKWPAEYEYIQQILGGKPTRDFLSSSISGRDCSGRAAVNPVEWVIRDYASPHEDFSGQRALMMTWNLAKEWEPKWGGAFYYGGAKTLEEGYFYPTFNTLAIFQPSHFSTHYVTPVNHFAKGRRMTITWNLFKGETIEETVENIDRPIEEIFGRKEDHYLLTTKDAQWITSKLSPKQYTSDPVRQQSLRDLKHSVEKNYLNPEDPAAFVVEWEEEDSEDDTQIRDDEIKKDMSITSESSILDFLDPDILEDDELLSEIGSNLRKGKIVVIQNAFKSDFAEYAWKQIERDDVIWEKEEISPADVPGAFSSKHTATTFTSELASVLGVFSHSKTREFLEGISGRSCSGPGPRLTPTWYKQGDHSEPRTWDSDVSVQIEWNLSKDWKGEYGGQFFWFPSRTQDHGFRTPNYNTLLLSLPTPSSTHAVLPSTKEAKGKHLSISASYTPENQHFTSNDHLEELFANDEDYISLTDQQAKWIVHEMEEDEMTGDPVQLQKLVELKENIRATYLYPSAGETHVFEF